MLLPIHTDTHRGEIGLVSIGIAALCLLVHVFVGPDLARTEREAQVAADQAVKAHRTAVQESADTAAGEYRSYLDIWDSLYSDTDLDVHQIDSVMTMLNADPESERLREEARLAVERQSLAYRLGLVANEFSLVDLLTHMFVHGGWMHLIVNMWFFYMCGVTMEHHWGHGRFVLAYLLCGAGAALSFLGVSWLSGVDIANNPLIGASGAVAGMMGAFMITHHRSKVKVFYILGLRGGVFDIGAVWYFASWVLVELFWTLMTLNRGAPVAYAAHVGGFVIGCALALLLPGVATSSRVKPSTSTAYFGVAGDTPQGDQPTGSSSTFSL